MKARKSGALFSRELQADVEQILRMMEESHTVERVPNRPDIDGMILAYPALHVFERECNDRQERVPDVT